MTKESPILASMRGLLNEQYDKVAKLREENETLKANVEFLHSCLDDRDKSIAIMEEENDKLKELLQKIGKENSELQTQVREQYYTIKQYERGFDIGSWEGDDERAG